MGKDHDLLKAARNNDFPRLIEMFSGKSSKSRFAGVKGTLKESIRGKKKSGPTGRPVWPVGDDGRFVVTGPLPQGIRLECRNQDGSTPLLLAALGGAGLPAFGLSSISAGHVEAVECLLAHGANVNAKDSKGNSALHMASWQERVVTADVVQILLTNGADPNLRNIEGDTALHNACQNGQQFIVQLLLDNGADGHIANQENSTALDVAARFDRRDVVALLLDHDSTIVESTRSLREAAKTGREAIVKILLDKGMDCNQKDEDTGETALHEAVRFYRVKIVELLMGYGADPYSRSHEDQTCLDLLQQQPANPKKTAMTELIEEYQEKEVIVPAVVLDQQRQRRAQQAVRQDDETVNEFKSGKRSYPVLRVRSRWTEDIATMRSLSDPKWPCTNLLSDDARLKWVAPQPGRHWVVFDFGKLYVLTAITITGSPSRSMPKDFQLEVSDDIAGPWRVIKAFVGPATCPEEHLDPTTGTFQQHFAGFHATSRYWRLMILRNHGSTTTLLHGINFHGVDGTMKKWFAEQSLTQYYDSFVEAGINQVVDLAHVNDNDLAELVTLAGHRKKIKMAVAEMKGEVQTFDRLIFFVQPPTKGRQGTVLTLFEVQANPGLTEEVELVVHGGATVTGTCVRRLIPNGPNPSLAYFDDIFLSPPGQYQLEVRAKNSPNVRCKAAHPTIIDISKKKRSALHVLFRDYECLLDF